MCMYFMKISGVYKSKLHLLFRLNMTEKLFTGTLNHNQNKTKQNIYYATVCVFYNFYFIKEKKDVLQLGFELWFA